MLRPSYSELMDVINQGNLVDSKVTSRYTIVLAAAKRARQIIDGANPLTYAPTDRAVSIAVNEMSEGKLIIKVQEDMLDGNYEHMLNAQKKNRSIPGVSKDDLREDLKDRYELDPYALDDDDADLFKDGYHDLDHPIGRSDADDEKDPYRLFAGDAFDEGGES